jgi:hypothetical protein
VCGRRQIAPIVVVDFCGVHWASWFAEDRDHVVAVFSDAAGSQRYMRRLSLVTGESNALGELGHELALMYPFAEGREVMARYEDGATDTIAIVDPTGTWPDETIESCPRGDNSRVLCSDDAARPHPARRGVPAA